MSRDRTAAVLILCALSLALTGLLAPAAAQAAGWIYLIDDNDIIAIRPDGTEEANLTADDARLYDHVVASPDGDELLTGYLDDVESNFVPGGIRIISRDGAAPDADVLRVENFARELDPAFGGGDQVIYYGPDQFSVRRTDRAGGPGEEVAFQSGNSISQPDGSPARGEDDRFLYVITSFASTVRVQQGEEVTHSIPDIQSDYGRLTAPKFTGPAADEVILACSREGELDRVVCIWDLTEDAVQIIDAPTDVADVAMSPDGSSIAIRSRADGSVWVMDRQGGGAQQIRGATSLVGGLSIEWGAEVAGGGEPDPDPDPDPDTGSDAPADEIPVGVVDGDPATTERVTFDEPIAYAAAISRSRFADASGAAFAQERTAAAYAVLARADEFADSLAGVSLAADGPILYSPTGELPDEVADELTRILPPGGVVYLLGGEVALSASVEAEVQALGLTPRRLQGPTRFETAEAVYAEALALGASTDDLIVARGTGLPDNPSAAWADSVTVGAYAARAGVPVLLTPTDSLHPTVERALEEHPGTVTLVGGEAALSAQVQSTAEDQAEGPVRRVAGTDRADTAVQIATTLNGFGAGGSASRTALVFDGFDADGWTFGLAGAGLAVATEGSLLVVGASSVPPATAEALSTCGEPEVETVILGWTSVVAESVGAELDELDGEACASP